MEQKQKQETSKIAEEIANEVYRLVTNRLRVVEELKKQLKRLDNQIQRLVAERREHPMKDYDASIVSLSSDIRKLRDEVSILKTELKGVKERQV